MEWGQVLTLLLCVIYEGKPRVRPVIKPASLVDLAVMLEALCGFLFDSIDMNFLSFKTALLFSLPSALSVHSFFTVYSGFQVRPHPNAAKQIIPTSNSSMAFELFSISLSRLLQRSRAPCMFCAQKSTASEGVSIWPVVYLTEQRIPCWIVEASLLAYNSNKLGLPAWQQATVGSVVPSKSTKNEQSVMALSSVPEYLEWNDVCGNTIYIYLLSMWHTGWMWRGRWRAMVKSPWDDKDSSILLFTVGRNTSWDSQSSQIRSKKCKIQQEGWRKGSYASPISSIPGKHWSRELSKQTTGVASHDKTSPQSAYTL